MKKQIRIRPSADWIERVAEIRKNYIIDYTGKELRRKRIVVGLSTMEISALIGVSSEQVRRIERGQYDHKSNSAMRLYGLLMDNIISDMANDIKDMVE